jgi:hypothetical protein
VSLLECFDELAAEDLAKNFFWEKELFMSGGNPVGVIERQAASRNDTVDVRMVLEFLIPGVEHAEKADLGAEMFGISGNFHQGFGTTAEQETVDNGLVLQGQRGQLVGHGEDDV